MQCGKMYGNTHRDNIGRFGQFPQIAKWLSNCLYEAFNEGN